MLTSALYTGTLRHRRLQPVPHEFSYRLFLAFLDIDDIPAVMKLSRFSSYNRLNWASFHEADHFGDPKLPLRTRLQRDAASHGVTVPDGPIFLLTHLRYLGYVFNPISFFYCFNAAGELEATMAEVNSTFGERRHYWLSAANRTGSGYVFRCRKKMHVSPFLPMDLDYRFALTPPGEKLAAHIATERDGKDCFDATLLLDRQPWNAATLRMALLRFPWMTARVIAAIHWQALRLWAKGVPFFPHPARGQESR